MEWSHQAGQSTGRTEYGSERHQAKDSTVCEGMWFVPQSKGEQFIMAPEGKMDFYWDESAADKHPHRTTSLQMNEGGFGTKRANLIRNTAATKF